MISTKKPLHPLGENTKDNHIPFIHNEDKQTKKHKTQQRKKTQKHKTQRRQTNTKT